MKRITILLTLLIFGCSAFHLRRVEGLKVNFTQFKNNTAEPELERILEEECIRVFRRGGAVFSEGGITISAEILKYVTSPYFYSAGKTTYRSSVKVKFEVVSGELRKTFILSEYEDYPRTEETFQDELLEEEAKRRMFSIIAEEAYEHVLEMTDE